MFTAQEIIHHDYDYDYDYYYYYYYYHYHNRRRLQLESLGYRLCDATFSRFSRTLTCDRQTQTQAHS